MRFQIYAATTAFAVLLITAMASGAASHSKSKPHPANPAGTVATGHALFITNCAPCHGANAQGDDGPNLHKLGLQDAVIASTVTAGIKDEMPPFGKKLTATQLQAIVAYVHSLQDSSSN